jgi:cell division protein FtsB
MGLLAASLFGMLFYLGSKIDGLAARLDARIDAQTARIDALNARMDTLTAQVADHLGRHVG